MTSHLDEWAVKARIMEELNRHPFRPAWWLKNRHAQTIWVGLVRKQAGRLICPRMRRERWDMPDGDFLDLVFLDGREDAPLVVLFHGMEATPQSYYISGYARIFKKLGWTFAVMFFRSCGFDMNRTATLYHLGGTEDPEFVLCRLRERYPDRPIFAIGVSLGGNVLCKWLGEQGEGARPLVDAAMILSAPYDPVATAPRFHKELNGFYARHFVKTLKPKALDLLKRFPGLLDEAAVRRAHDFYTFDDAVTSQLYGFKDAEDYWGKTGCGQFVDGIRVPTLLLTSTDDSFVLPECVPYAASEASPHLYPLFPDHGGHAAFVSGALPCCPRSWYEEQSLRFFKAQLRLRDRFKHIS